MKTQNILLLATFLALGAAPVPALCEAGGHPPQGPAHDGNVAQLLSEQLLSFEATHGQAGRRMEFISRSPGATIYLTPNEAAFVLRNPAHEWFGKTGAAAKAPSSALSNVAAEVVRMKLIGAEPHAKGLALAPLAGKINYLLGSDPKRWRTNIATCAKVRYEKVYPGVDVVYYGNERQLEFDFVLAPGADPKTIALEFEGARKLELDAQGDLAIQTTSGQKIVHHKPHIYQELKGVRRQVSGGYALTNHEVGFQVAAYDRSKPLVIDPTLSFSTYLGGSGTEQADAVAVDADGNVYIAGGTASMDFPLDAVLQQRGDTGLPAAFVTKLDSAGNLVFSTFLGYHANASGIALDANGNIYVTGGASIDDFPTTPGVVQPHRSGDQDAYVLKLNPDGASLAFSTFLGGSGPDAGLSIAVDGAGNSYVMGMTGSPNNFPITANALQPAFGGTSGALGGWGDYFVTKLNATGSGLIYSTYLGGSDDEGDTVYGYRYSGSIAVDLLGNAYVTGSTRSTDFPTTLGSFQPTRPGRADLNMGRTDAILTKINADGTLGYSTYLGGTDNDNGLGVAVDQEGSAYVTGATESCDFPFQKQAHCPSGQYGGPFVAKVSPDGLQLLYCTYLGGQGEGTAIAVNSTGHAFVTGGMGTGFIPVNAIQPGFGGNAFGSTSDAFVAELAPDGNSFIYSTFLGGKGGSAPERSWAIALSPTGDAYVAGVTSSTNFPTTMGAFQSQFGGGDWDSFVAKISPDPVCLAGVSFEPFSPWYNFQADIHPCPPPDQCPANSVTVPVDAGACSVGIPTRNLAFFLPSGQAALDALVDNSANTDPIVVTAATYDGNPTSTSLLDTGGGYADLRVLGQAGAASVTANFYYPSSVAGTAEDALTLQYFDGANWLPILSSGSVAPVKNTADNLDGTSSGGRFTVTFDDTSTPKMTDLTGTVLTAALLDTKPPVVHCPASIVTGMAPGQCSAVVNFTVTATDDSGSARVVCSPASGSSFPKGTTTVACTATDPSKNQASCSFTVTVNDTQPPRIGCPADIFVQTDFSGGSGAKLVTFATPAATDNCGGSTTVVCAPASGSSFGLGTTLVTCATSDSSGNHSSCSFNVVVSFSPANCQTVGTTLDQAKVHFHHDGTRYADFKGELMLLNGTLPSDFRDATLVAHGRLQVFFGNSAAPAYCNDHLNFAVKAVNKDQDTEQWEYNAGGSEKITYQWNDHVVYNANADKSLPASVGQLASQFIHSAETELRFDFTKATFPITITINDEVLVTVVSKTSVTSPYPIDLHGQKVDVLWPARIVPGDVVAWYADDDSGRFLNGLLYTQTIGSGSAASTYYAGGGKFDIQVPITGVNFGDQPRTATVQIVIGTPGASQSGCATLTMPPAATEGTDHWQFQDNDVD